MLAYDQLGHGRTAQKEAELAFFQLANPAEHVSRDAEQMATHLANYIAHGAALHPRAFARVLYGPLSVSANRGHFQGAVLVGTAAATVGAGLGRALLGVLNKLVPRH